MSVLRSEYHFWEYLASIEKELSNPLPKLPDGKVMAIEIDLPPDDTNQAISAIGAERIIRHHVKDPLTYLKALQALKMEVVYTGQKLPDFYFHNEKAKSEKQIREVLESVVKLQFDYQSQISILDIEESYFEEEE